MYLVVRHDQYVFLYKIGELKLFLPLLCNLLVFPHYLIYMCVLKLSSFSFKIDGGTSSVLYIWGCLAKFILFGRWMTKLFSFVSKQKMMRAKPVYVIYTSKLRDLISDSPLHITTQLVITCGLPYCLWQCWHICPRVQDFQTQKQKRRGLEYTTDKS